MTSNLAVTTGPPPIAIGRTTDAVAASSVPQMTPQGTGQSFCFQLNWHKHAVLPDVLQQRHKPAQECAVLR